MSKLGSTTTSTSKYVLIQRPMAAVTDFLAEEANDPLWRGDMAWPIRSIPTVVEVDETTRRMAFSTRSTWAITRVEYTWDLLEDQTRLTAAVTVAVDGEAKTVSAARLQRVVDAEMEGLGRVKYALEAEGKPSSFDSWVPPAGTWRAHPALQVAVAVIVAWITGALLWPLQQEAHLASDGGPRFAVAVQFIGASAITIFMVAIASVVTGNLGHIAAVVVLWTGDPLGPVLRALPHSVVLDELERTTKLDPVGQWIVLAWVVAAILPFVLLGLPHKAGQPQYKLFALAAIPALAFLAVFHPWTLS